jgi:hypothetical protein
MVPSFERSATPGVPEERQVGMPDAHAMACQSCSVGECDVDTRLAFF